MSRKASTVLSEVKVLLNNDGNVEVEYSDVPYDGFKEAMERKVPEYVNTHIILGFMKKLKNLSIEYYNNVNNLLT